MKPQLELMKVSLALQLLQRFPMFGTHRIDQPI
jgi:hypothetical protein